MSTKQKSIVLDSWAILAMLQGEPAGPQVADIIADAHDAGSQALMTVVNAGEVWYIIAREMSDSNADDSINDVKNIGVQLVDVDWQLTRLAAGIKARGRISYADAYAAALAIQMKCELVTGDPEFKTLGNEIKIRWLARENRR